MKTKEQIDELIQDVKDLGNRIKSIDNLIAAIDNPDLKQQYNKDLLRLVGNYKKMLILLQQEIVLFIKYEREQNLPITLLYRRILKTLKQG